MPEHFSRSESLMFAFLLQAFRKDEKISGFVLWSPAAGRPEGSKWDEAVVPALLDQRQNSMVGSPGTNYDLHWAVADRQL